MKMTLDIRFPCIYFLRAETAGACLPHSVCVALTALRDACDKTIFTSATSPVGNQVVDEGASAFNLSTCLRSSSRQAVPTHLMSRCLGVCHFASVSQMLPEKSAMLPVSSGRSWSDTRRKTELLRVGDGHVWERWAWLHCKSWKYNDGLAPTVAC